MTEPAQRSDAWHRQRLGRVTGSIAGAILSVDPNKTRAQVLRRMVRDQLGAPREDENAFVEDVIFGYGRMNEPGALLDFQMDTGLTVEECGFFAYEDWLGASPDGLTSDGGVLEIKAPWSRRKGQEREFKSLADQPQYYAQVQIEMLCAGREKAHFYTWSADKQVHETVGIDHEWLDQNLPRLRQFHAEFQDELSNEDHLAPLRVVIDTPEAAKCTREWDEICEQQDLLAERKSDLLAQMVDMAGSRDATIAGRKLTLVEKAGSVSYAKVVKAKLPDLDLSPWTGRPSSYWKMT